jgi:membrane protease YdiL (CAAX protease family)
MKRRALLHVVSLTVIVIVVTELFRFAALPLENRLSTNPRLFVSLSTTRAALAEALCLLGVWLFLRRHGRSFTELGLWKKSPCAGWIFGVALGLFTVGSALMNLKFNLGTPIMAVFDPAPWHVYTALVVGLSAGFNEEIMFRGFIMTELADAGFGRVLQVLASGFLFGAAHVGVLRSGLAQGLGVIVPTAILGMMYSLVYLTARRSLMPSIVSHFMNDAIVLPLIYMAQALGAVR